MGYRADNPEGIRWREVSHSTYPLQKSSGYGLQGITGLEALEGGPEDGSHDELIG
jgi:hypothetical protein